ncbi:MAG: ParM/StbA family protein [Anaerolineae bacterium]|nr:ParM/StbA family protein [Anaerolineae bacterium]
MFHKRNSPQGSQLTIGLDIGYGVTKAVTSEQVITFPSVCGHAREIKFRAADLTAKYPGDQIKDDDGRWFVGDLALGQLPPGELLRLRGRTVDEAHIGNVFRVRLAKVAIGKLLAGVQHGEAVHIRVSTGLPVDHLFDAADLKAALMGQHLIQTDTTEVVANISEVMVMPQPYGSLYAQTLLPNGDINPHHTFIRTGVCDVGTYTVDLALDDDGVYVDAESGSVESGVYTAQERIAALLERDHRQKMPFKLIEEVLRTGRIRISGEDVDYRAEVQEALEPLRSATLNLMGEKWKAGKTVDVIYLSGGGAELVKEVVMSAYKQTQLVKTPQIANARGYLNYAYFQAQG